MKKLIIMSVLSLAFASTVSADTLTGTEFTLNGQKYGGFHGSKNLVGQYVGNSGAPVVATTTRALFGNTRVVDFLKVIRAEDVKAFLAIVYRAGIRFE